MNFFFKYIRLGNSVIKFFSYTAAHYEYLSLCKPMTSMLELPGIIAMFVIVGVPTGIIADGAYDTLKNITQFRTERLEMRRWQSDKAIYLGDLTPEGKQLSPATEIVLGTRSRKS